MLAFTRNKRCGGATVESVLRASFNYRHCELTVRRTRRDDPVVAAEELARTQFVYPSLESVSGRGVVPWSNLATTYPHLRFFTFVRTPLERCASEYQHRVGFGGLRKTFESWIQSPAARNHQVRQLCGAEDADLAIDMIRGRMGFVGLVERFNESLVLFRRWANDGRIDIRYHAKNVSRDRRIRCQLLRNLETRRLLIDANREDLKLHDYIAQTVFPQQIGEYGARFEMDLEAFEAFNVPPPAFPRQLPAAALRTLVRRPLMRWLTLPTNPTAAPVPPPTIEQPEPYTLRRAA